MPWPKGAQPVAQTQQADTTQPDQTQTINTPGEMLKATAPIIGNLALGAGRGLYGTMSALPAYAAQHLPGGIKADPAKLAERKQIMTPANTGQAIGKGIEQAGEFMLPGPAEEKLASMAPAALRTAARIGTAGLGSGAINAAQGGDFGTGAALGAGGAALSAAGRAAAPKLAESALGVRAPQRAFGKTPGIAALEETKGIRPETILDSGRQRMKDLVQTLEGHVDAASQRATPPVRGFLMPPREEVPLHVAGGAEGRLSEPVRLTQADRPIAHPQLPAPSLSTPMASGRQAEFPERLASGDTSIRTPAGPPHPGMGQAQYIGEIPGERGGPGQVQGILYRRPEMSGSVPPATVPNPTASLRGARDVLSSAQNRAAQQEAGTLHGQLGQMQDFLHQGRVSGEPIPENVTPRRLLDLKRGFSDEHLRWNPDVHDEAVHAGRGAYHQMDTELDRLVPASENTNQRISSLIEVLRNADRQSRQAGLGQKLLGRFGAHTGALAGGVGGAYYGGREGGLPGAVAGGTLGLLAPELIASPEGQMGTARLLRNIRTLRPAVGAAAQLTRGNE